MGQTSDPLQGKGIWKQIWIFTRVSWQRAGRTRQGKNITQIGRNILHSKTQGRVSVTSQNSPWHANHPKSQRFGKWFWPTGKKEGTVGLSHEEWSESSCHFYPLQSLTLWKQDSHFLQSHLKQGGKERTPCQRQIIAGSSSLYSCRSVLQEKRTI